MSSLGNGGGASGTWRIDRNPAARIFRTIFSHLRRSSFVNMRLFTLIRRFSWSAVLAGLLTVSQLLLGAVAALSLLQQFLAQLRTCGN